MKINFKTLIITCMLCLFSGMGVHAGQQCIEATVSVSPESGEITVQGSAAMRQPIVLLLISADTDEALLDTLDDQDAEKLLYSVQTALPKNGTFSFVITPSSDMMGKNLKAVLSCGQSETPAAVEFTVYTMDDVNRLIERINACTDGSDIISIITDGNNASILGLDMSFMPFVSQTDKVGKAMLADLPLDSESIRGSFLDSSIFNALIQSDSTAEILDMLADKEYLERIGITEAFKTYYDKLGDNNTRFMKLLKNSGAESAEAFKTETVKGLLLCAVESSRYTQIEAVLADFDKYITYNKSGIKSMKDPTIAYTAVAGNYYESIGDFQKALDNAVSAAHNDSGGKTPSKSTGGGGGGGGSFSVQPPSAIPAEPVKPEPDTAEESCVYSDVGNDFSWAVRAINRLTSENVLQGYADKTFLPEKNVTRAEFLKMIITAADAESGQAENCFSDIRESDWFYPYVLKGVNLGIVSGYEDKTFRPEAFISRQDMAVMVNNAVKACCQPRIISEEGVMYNDAESIADYAKDSVYELSGMQIMRGSDNMFRPNDLATRAEASVIIYNAFFRMEESR